MPWTAARRGKPAWGGAGGKAEGAAEGAAEGTDVAGEDSCAAW